MIHGESDALLALCLNAIDMDPANYRCFYQLARNYAYTSHFAKAEKAARKAIDLVPNSEAAHYLLGSIFLEVKRPTDALKEFGLDPDESDRRESAALVNFALQKNREADSALEAMLRLGKISSPTAIAEIYAYRGDLDNAFLWFDLAAEFRKDQLDSINRDPLLPVRGPLRSDLCGTSFLQRPRLEI